MCSLNQVYRGVGYCRRTAGLDLLLCIWPTLQMILTYSLSSALLQNCRRSDREARLVQFNAFVTHYLATNISENARIPSTNFARVSMLVFLCPPQSWVEWSSDRKAREKDPMVAVHEGNKSRAGCPKMYLYFVCVLEMWFLCDFGAVFHEGRRGMRLSEGK